MKNKTESKSMMSRGARWAAGLFLFFVCVSIGMTYLAVRDKSSEEFTHSGGLTKSILARALGGGAGTVQKFPGEIDLPIDGKTSKAIIQYAFDPKLQEFMEGLFQSYRPDFGAFVAIDAQTGRVLSMVSYTHGQGAHDNLALRATFPSASVFKVVTAAAAIAERNFSADTVIQFNGSNHTLYKSNILKTNVTRHTRFMTLKQAFALSVNTVFGKIGAFTVGADELRNYAGRFGFNRQLAADFPIQEGRALIVNDAWALAETASGYTRDNTMSPLQGALIAAAVANDGLMMEPYVVQSVHTLDGTQIYAASPTAGMQAVEKSTADQIRALMRETVSKGTSRRTFRGFHRGDMADVDVGGKTGSLTGMDPPGKYDWFVGYAEENGRKIAIASLTVHEKLWRVKSSYLARRAIETYFQVEKPAKSGKTRRGRGSEQVAGTF